MTKVFGMIVVAVFGLSSCTASINTVAPPNGAIVQGNVQVSSDRRTAYFSLKNGNSHDLVCGPVYKRVVFDAPQSYLDVGEAVSSDGAVYFSAGQTIVSEVRVSDFPNRSGGGAEIQFATFGSKAIECRWADIREYCDAIFIDQVNDKLVEEVTEELLSDFDVKSCQEIVEKVEKVKFWQRIDKISGTQKEFLSKFARYGLLE